MEKITGYQLRSQRNALRLTQMELASKLGVSQRTIVSWERSEVPLSKVLRVHTMLFQDGTPENVTLSDFSTEELLSEMLRRESFRADQEQARRIAQDYRVLVTRPANGQGYEARVLDAPTLQFTADTRAQALAGLEELMDLALIALIRSR